MLDIISRSRSWSQTRATVESFLDSHSFAHIISLNPENLILASQDPEFARALDRAQVLIADGVGILAAAKILGIPAGDRITGVDLMADLIRRHLDKNIVFLGGRHRTASRALAYFKDLVGGSHGSWVAIDDVSRTDERVGTRVREADPHILFVAFGSPYQELWIEAHREELRGVVCMGVGQAFDVYSGAVRRAPLLIRAWGLEWLYRLLTQPWRWRRQLRLLKFIILVLGRLRRPLTQSTDPNQ